MHSSLGFVASERVEEVKHKKSLLIVWSPKYKSGQKVLNSMAVECLTAPETL